jgi:hypothetical protein
MLGEKREAAFWAKVDKRGDGGCWEWTAYRMGQGNPDRAYGVFQLGRKTALAHRVSWALANGREPTKSICHRCDNPSCVNPAHLWEGGQSENMIDCSKKGRKRSKLNPDDVRGIRRMIAMGIQQSHIANWFGVCQSSITYIKQRKNWGHVA